MFTETNNYETRNLYMRYSHGISCFIRSVYAVVPVFTIASDTIRRVVIYFDQEETDVDSCYKTNNQEINVLDSLLEERINSRYITALNVVTFVSPDGDSVYNAALSVRRNNSMREFLRQRYPYVDVEKIKLTSEGEDWSELRKLVRRIQTCRTGKKS